MFNFLLILSGLRTVIAAGAARDRALTGLLVALHGRIGRIGQRLDRLLARWRAGTLPKARASRAGAVRASRTAPLLRFPARKGWLRAKLGHEVSAYASQLQHQLGHAECQAFLAACPQAGRILRPLLRMLTPDPLPAVLQRVKPAVPVAGRVAEMVGIVGAPVSQILEA